MKLRPKPIPQACGIHEDIREAFDLDSMDFVNLIVAIHNRIKVDIPEADYNKLFTLESAIVYLQDTLARAKSRGR